MLADMVVKLVDRRTIRGILEHSSPESPSTRVAGWIKSVRKQKRIAFLEVNDGSSKENLQVVACPSVVEKCLQFLCRACFTLFRLKTGSSISIEGDLCKSSGFGQTVELRANKIVELGSCSPDVHVTL